MSTSMEYLVIDSNFKTKKPRPGQSVWTSIKHFFYDDKYFGGRNLEDWFKLFLFYWTFYWVLIAFCVLVFAMFYLSIDKNEPRLEQTELYYDRSLRQLREEGPNPPNVYSYVGLMLPNPGMSFKPQPDYRSTLVRFVQGRPSSYKPFTDHIQAYLELYEDKLQEGEVFTDCDNFKEDNNRDKKRVCRFKVDMLGGGCTWQRDYGYDDGQPCILLKLNKVFGWEPIPYGDNATRPAELGDRWSPTHIGVTCQGEGPLDEENVGPIEYWPREGFPVIYYPYINQEGYRAPLVFIKFMKPANGVVINIWCKAWAKNIIHHREDRAGSIHFELLVD